MMKENTLWALMYACRTSVAVPGSPTVITQYRAFRARDPYKVNGVIQTHGWNGDPLPTDPVPIGNDELALVSLWDERVDPSLCTEALQPDDYWPVRAMIDEELEIPEDRTCIAVYRFYNAAGQLLYVGQTSQFGLRQGRHHLTQPWEHEIDDSKTTLECHWSRGEALAREKHLIQTERPLHNVQHAVR